MEKLREQLGEVVGRLFGGAGAELPEVEVMVAPSTVAEETGADYASNIAMKLAKVAHRAPMSIAEEIAGEMTAAVGQFKVEVAAPGFLNFISPDEYYDEKIAEMARNEGIFSKNMAQDEYSGKTVVAEFSDPNPFKVLHVGHLYTSVVGDSISRLLEAAGARVVRANFGGDVGLHVAKTIYALLDSFNCHASDFSGDASRQPAVAGVARCMLARKLRTPPKNGSITIEDIAQCYVEGTRAYDEDEKAREEIGELNRVIYALAELGEEKCRERLELERVAEDFGKSTAEIAQVSELYWRGRELSYEYFKDFYAKIGVKFDKFYPESSVAGRGLQEVREHVGDVYEESKGAIVYRGEKVGLHTRVFINAQGVPTYEAKDVGLIFTKWADWKFDESIVVTGNEQTEYMKVVLASVKEYAPELVERTRHLTHGLVKLAGNVKMSSRKGNFLKAVDVINMVAQEVIETSSSGTRRVSPPSRVPRAACSLVSSAPPEEESRLLPVNQVITLAALKYTFLKYKVGGDIVFDPKESVAVNGNSGVYLLYSVVRAKKIMKKLGDVQSPSSVGSFSDEEGKYVRRLSKKIVQYEEMLAEAIRGMAPYKLCAYLYELAQEWSRFYERVRVVGGGKEGELEKYVRAYVGVMENGLGLLGIEVPEEM